MPAPPSAASDARSGYPLPDDALDALPFEAVMERLDALVARLEDPALGLDAAVALYEEGTRLARHGLARLDAAEARVHTLTLE